MTVQISVGIRTILSGEPFPVEGTVPHQDSALAVVPVHNFNNALKVWTKGEGWCVTHRPTGLRLPGDFATAEAAHAALLTALPGFPGWLMATGRDGCAATGACKAMWRVARQ